MKRLIPTFVVAAVCVHAGLPAPAGAEPAWSMRKLPGCENLSSRMAGYYRPVTVDVRPAAPQYTLPIDLAKLTNADFKGKVYQFRDKTMGAPAEAMLKRNAFVVFGGPGHDDVARFYKWCKTAGVPIFITSDSLLHLYHIQFDETLKDIEEREFFKDATLISKAIQAEAIRLQAVVDERVSKGIWSSYSVREMVERVVRIVIERTVGIESESGTRR